MTNLSDIGSGIVQAKFGVHTETLDFSLTAEPGLIILTSCFTTTPLPKLEM